MGALTRFGMLAAIRKQRMQLGVANPGLLVSHQSDCAQRNPIGRDSRNRIGSNEAPSS